MNHKNMLIPITVFLLLSSVLIALAQIYGVSLGDILVGAVAYTLYGLLIVVFFLRFALIFIGVFAIYRVLLKQQYKESAI